MVRSRRHTIARSTAPAQITKDLEGLRCGQWAGRYAKLSAVRSHELTTG